jgi:Phage integrase, N-terminal SAM-like domain
MESQMEGKRLLERVRDKIRAKHYSIRTEEAYLQWMWRFALVNKQREPLEMGAAEVEAFLSRLAVAWKVSASNKRHRV